MKSRTRSLRNKILLPVAGGIVFYVLMIAWANLGIWRRRFEGSESPGFPLSSAWPS